MRMSPWVPGLLDLMSNISMIGDFAVVLHLVKCTHILFLLLLFERDAYFQCKKKGRICPWKANFS